jgi:hypothetical protein
MRQVMIVVGVLAMGFVGCGKKDEGGKAPEKKGADKVADQKGADKPADPPPPPPAAEVKLAELDCSAAGEAYKGWKLMAPEGAKCEEKFGALEVSAAEGFYLEVHSGKLDMAGRRKENDANDINKIKKYHLDSPEAVVYESEAMPGKSEFHFIAGMKVGDADVSCEDQKGPFWTQAQVEGMLKACQSLKK